MKETLKIVGIVIATLLILFIVFLSAIYRPFYQPCETMGDWSTNVPYRCVKEAKGGN